MLQTGKKHVLVSHSLPAFFLPMYLNMNTYASKHTNTFNAREREGGGRGVPSFTVCVSLGDYDKSLPRGHVYFSSVNFS